MADEPELPPLGDEAPDHGDIAVAAPLKAATIDNDEDDTEIGAGANDANDADPDQDQDQADEGEEMQDQSTPLVLVNGSLGNRYREILRDQHETGSQISSIDGESVDALPRRAVSPIDSVMSGPDDTPSVQVRR
jgi:hypothetical protein